MPEREREFTSFEAAKACGVFHTTLIGWVNKGRLKASPDTSPIKILAVSGQVLTERERASLDEHADGFLAKPFKLAEFTAKAAGLLGLSPV